MEKPSEESQRELEAYNSQVDILTLPFYTRAQLRQYNGQDKPQIYVAIKGHIYDVTSNRRSYGAGSSYHKLVGKDVSRLLGTNKLELKPGEGLQKHGPSSVKEWDTSDFTEKQHQTLDKWVVFFRRRYKIVGVVVDNQLRRYDLGWTPSADTPGDPAA